MKPQAVMHKRTGAIKEMRKTWMGLVIWMMEHEEIPKDAIACWPYIIYEDDKKFFDYEILGKL